MDYCDLPQAIWGSIAKHFGIEVDDGEVRRMQETAQVNAKMPQQPFVADSKDKQQEASEAERVLTRELLEPLYLQLSNEP